MFFKSGYSWIMATFVWSTDVTWRIWNRNKTVLNEDGQPWVSRLPGHLTVGDHSLGAHCWEVFVSIAKMLPSATWWKFLTPSYYLHTQCFLSIHLSHSVQCLCLFSSFYLSSWLLSMPDMGSSWCNKDALTFEGWNMYTDDDQACARKEVRGNACRSRGRTHSY